VKKIKNMKLLRKPSRPGKPKSLIIEKEVIYSDAAIDLVNTMFRTVIRNVNNNVISKDDVAPISTILPLLIMRHWYNSISCDDFCGMFRDNWHHIEPYICLNYNRLDMRIIEQSKALTMNDEL